MTSVYLPFAHIYSALHSNNTRKIICIVHVNPQMDLFTGQEKAMKRLHLLVDELRHTNRLALRSFTKFKTHAGNKK
jgi:hypothetical protein